MKRQNQYRETLCWSCQNSVPGQSGRGCAWSVQAKPIQGWQAERTYHPDAKKHKGYASYLVTRCPEYRREVDYWKRSQMVPWNRSW